MEKVMEKACGMFHEVLYKLTEKGHFQNESDVETAKAAVSAIVKIKTLEAMERFEGGGGSSFRGRSYDGRSYDGRSYDGGSYEDGGSYRRGRGSNGRYVSRDSYSSRDGMRDKLESLMQEATGQDKEMIREMLSRM